jgi:adenylate cyclase
MPETRRAIGLLDVYIPMDRRQALARGTSLPEYLHGAALFADICGFMPLAEGLVRELGPQRGAEELTRHLNRVYDALINELHSYGGSVIGFGGDAITCWFDEEASASPGQAGLRATACALAMQAAMDRFVSLDIPSGGTVSLAMKAAVASGTVRRFMVGAPQVQVMDVLVGATLDRLAKAEGLAKQGEVVLDPAAVVSLDDDVRIVEWRDEDEMGGPFGVVQGLTSQATLSPWPSIPPDALCEEQVRPWLLPPVYERLRAGQGDFLAELRPVVALFLRFSGIDYDGDEEAGTKLDAYIQQVQRVLADYEGTLLQLSIDAKGSYLYATFGAPLAHEDDAVRAVSAAFELRALSAALDFIDAVQIGISQGQMRTGAYGGTRRRTYGVLGDEANLAARLMQAAGPGQILVSQAAQEATAERFTWQSLPDIRVKGKAELVTLFSLVGRRARHTIHLHDPKVRTPMVGRDSELAMVEGKLKRVLDGRGQLVAFSAEAGMGKSRLVAEVIAMVNEQGVIGYGGECQSYGTNASYLVWHDIWRGFFGLDPTQPLEEQVRSLEAQLAQIDPALVPRRPLLGAVLQLPILDNDLTGSFDAKLRKSSLEALLVDCLRARAREAPLFIVLEDCHWLDALSHDLLEVIGRAIADLPVLIIMTYRPPEMDGRQALRVNQLAHFSEVRLADFTPQEAQRLIGLKLAQFSGSRAEVPRALVERIVQRAQGNPFYIEELLNYLHDRGIAPDDSRALEQLDLPSSLHSLILSRIDQLDEHQKTTLKVASVVGRLFKAAMLWGAYPQLGQPDRVKADLEALSRLDLTPLDTPEPELTYFFRHIITQEVAYESLPFATRAMLHDQMGQYLEKTQSDALIHHVDLLAYHYARSQNEVKKREYLLKAGEAAQAEYANAVAEDHYRRLLPLLPPEEQVAVNLKLGQVLELVGEWNEAGELYRGALDLAERLDERRARAQCRTAIGELFRKRGEYADASRWLEGARAAFEELDDEAGIGQVLHSLGTLAAQRGNLEEARALYQDSLLIRYRLVDKPNIANVLNNLGVLARSQGNYEMARAVHEEALRIRRDLGDRRGIAVSLNNLGNVVLDQGNYDEARARLEEAVALQREVGDRAYIANALNNLGNVARAQGDYATAHALYRESLVIVHELGAKWDLAYLLEDIGCLAALHGQSLRALRLVAAATLLREAIGQPRLAVEQSKLERLLESVRQGLGDAAQASAQAEGRSMTLEQAIAYALEGHTT